jgi:DNA polymerase elongation subunit (family B)
MNTCESAALRQLQSEGKSLHAGDVLQYVITDYYNKNKNKRPNRRAMPIEMIDSDNNNNNTTTAYDARRYTELLAEEVRSITEPFGFVDAS